MSDTDADIEHGVIVCPHILQANRPVLYVEHSTDGMWQFMCGLTDHDGIEGAEIVGINHLLERDPSLIATLGLAPGLCAERENTEQSWNYGPADELEKDKDDGE